MYDAIRPILRALAISMGKGDRDVIWGAIFGGAVGLIYYVLRSGCTLFVRDLQEAMLGRPHIVVVQAILHGLMPAGIAALISWAVA